MNTKDAPVFINNNIAWNQVKKHVRDINRNGQNTMAKTCKENPRKFWNYIKWKTKKNNPVPDLVYKNLSGIEITAEADDKKANVLCDFFH